MMYGFENELTNAIFEAMGNNVTVTFQDIKKNNGIVQRGCIVREDGCNISPTIYIDDFAEQEMTVPEMTMKIVEIYNANKVGNFDVDQITNYEAVMPKLRAKLINAERNEEYVKDKVHAKFLNLYILPYVSLGSDERGQMSVVVTHDLAKNWNIDDDEILYVATRNLKHNCQSMRDVMVKMMIPDIAEMGLSDEEAKEYLDIIMPDDGTMWVATNDEKFNGATVLLDKDLLHTMADKLDSELIIIPSSIHECIIVPVGRMGIDDINAMINDVNTTQVADADYLSDTAYRFLRETGDVIIA